MTLLFFKIKILKKMKQHRYIIGVHSGHDASACIFEDNKIICAIQKERLSRIKHDSGEPIEAIEYLLESANIIPENIDLVVRCNWHNAQDTDDKYYKKFPRVIVNYNHHLFHAYSVSLALPYDSLILVWVVDGHGCRPEDCGLDILTNRLFYETESVYLANGPSLVCVEKKFAEYKKHKFKRFSAIDSIGYAYNSVAKTIFNSAYDAGKVMALAAFGQEDYSIPDVLNNDNPSDTLLNNDWLIFLNDLQYLSWKNQISKNISLSLQNALEKYTLSRITNLIKKYKCNNIAFGGGVSLNCKNNGNISNKDIVNNLFLFPACDDSGISIGAGIWALRNIYLCNNQIYYDPFLGKRYDTKGFTNEICIHIARLLANGYTIGIFEGGSEFGPRALGHRSILCKATDIKFKIYLNEKIKKRELFRPFGGIILQKNISSITSEIVSNDYMLTAVTVNEYTKLKYPALIHTDGTLRLQIIRDFQSTLARILRFYEDMTGDILIINTSFNGCDEPIVETPEQAILCARKNNIPYVAYNGDIIEIY